MVILLQVPTTPAVLSFAFFSYMLFDQKSPALLVPVVNGGDRGQTDIATYRLKRHISRFSENVITQRIYTLSLKFWLWSFISLSWLPLPDSADYIKVKCITSFLLKLDIHSCQIQGSTLVAKDLQTHTQSYIFF